MLQSGIRLLDAASGDVIPSAPQGSVLASSENSWRGIAVEHHCINPMEMAPHHLVGHRLVINVGQPVAFEWKNAARWKQTTYETGSFALQSHSDFHAPRWHQPFEFVAVALEPQFVSRFVGKESVEFQEMRGHHDSTITQMAVRMKNLLAAGAVEESVFTQALTTAFAFHLLQGYSTQSADLRLLRGRLEGRSLKRVIEFAQDNINQPLTLEQLAAQAHLSPFHFARQFKATLGLSPHQFLLKIRIDKARQLMSGQQASRRSLTDIAFATGFYDQSHFVHAFKRLTGYTPKAYIKTAATA
jgi:AraC family transcriptional regulator